MKSSECGRMSGESLEAMDYRGVCEKPGRRGNEQLGGWRRYMSCSVCRKAPEKGFYLLQLVYCPEGSFVTQAQILENCGIDIDGEGSLIFQRSRIKKFLVI
jgi:hypothetical protein